MFFHPKLKLLSILTLALTTWLGLIGPVLAQGPIHVTPGGHPAATGTNWFTDTTTLQHALSLANNGDEIWVATGVYTPGTTVNDTFSLPPGVALYGGFDPAGGADEFAERDWTAHPTILSGDIDGNDTTDASGVVTTTTAIVGSNAYHVLYLDGTSVPITGSTVIDGFTITAGQANDNSPPNNSGGGLYCDGNSNGECSPSLTNITFAGNEADFDGGAMYNDGDHGESSPSLTNIIFSGNSTVIFGGAMYNDGHYGNSSPSLTNVTFSGNSAGSSGGAMYNEGGLDGSSNPSLINVTFSGNSATGLGGAMYNCGNGGESKPSLTNVTFSGNSAGSSGGAIYNWGHNGNNSPSLTNVILWGNTAITGTQLYNYAATPVLSYTLIQSNTNDIYNTSGGSVTFGSGILTTDPRFVDAAAGDLRLQDGSPAIDSGTAAGAPAFDIRGLPRPANSGVDMGAYEMQGSNCYLPLIMK